MPIATLFRMRALYFAYGSNLKLERMQGRVPSARVVGPARLPGFRLTCDKRGADDSAKANLLGDPAGRVWGVVYSLDPADWVGLDACEDLYARVEVEVELDAGGARCAALTYVSEARIPEPIPVPWYWRLILEGAREHALPEDWLRTLEALPLYRL